MSIVRAAEVLVDEFRSRPTVRAGSLIITVYGDAIAPRGGPVWVGSLIGAMEAFGVSDRLVRTSVFRLSEDDWLDSTSIGRRSYYGLTAHGRQELEHASQRIYGEPREAWSGEWCVVLLGGVSAVHREDLRRDLEKLGFGSISSSVMAHPDADDQALHAVLDRKALSGDVVVLTGRSAGSGQDRQLRLMAQKSWDLDGIEARYLEFLERFRPALQATEASAELAPHAAFLVRTLLIHEYRRIILRDPLLPAELLPEDWHGIAAYRLCRNLYRAVYAAADRYIETAFATAEGPIPPPGPSYYRRFGGLD